MPTDQERSQELRELVAREISSLPDDARDYLGEVLRLEKQKLSLQKPNLNKDLTDIAKRIIK